MARHNPEITKEDIKNHNPEITSEEFPTRSNLARIINSMNEIRTVSLNTQNCGADQKDKYLNLATQLADRIKLTSSPELVKQMQTLVDALGKDEKLLKYDPSQDKVWKRKNPDFNRTLEEVTIKILQDSFNSLDSKHHILQAVKVLSVQEAQFNVKEKVYETVIPFNGKVEGIKSGVFSSVLGSMLGDSFVIEADDGLNLKVKGDLDLIEGLLNKAKEKGYKSVSVEMYEGDYRKFVEKFPDSQITQWVSIEPKFLGIKYDPQKMRKRAGKLIKWTTPLSYPVIGAMPASIQRRIRNYATDKQGNTFFNDSNATVASGAVSGVGGVVGGLTSIALLGPTPFALIPAGYFAIEGIIRIVSVAEDNKKMGSAPVKAIALPLEKVLNSKDKIKDEKGKYCLVNISLVDPEAKDNTVNFFDYFTRIARVEVPQEVEDNLVWSPANHHQYGLQFGGFLNEKIPALKEDKSLERELNKESQNYLLYNIREIEDFTKITALVCSRGERYVVSLVCDSNVKDKIKTISTVLGNKTITQSEKAKDLCARMNAYYTRIAKVSKDTIIEKEYLR
ncbi:hypothetical protein HY837_06245 [archaeon]|nr:hypothetical protein [archaeon]